MIATDQNNLIADITAYWDHHIHDLAIVTNPVGTPGFFRELDEYRYDKLNYLPRLVDFASYRGKKLLEIGCGAGIDLVRFARAGAIVTGVDLSTTSIGLARQNFAQNGLDADLQIMNGEAMEFTGNTFDVVYAHGVLQYTADANRMIAEIHRVLKPGGQSIMMVYNRHGWLNFMSKVTKVQLEHEDAPVLKMFTMTEFQEMLKPFKTCRIVPERYPVKTKLHSGWKSRLFNTLFVGTFNLLPRSWVRPLGWHLMAFASK
jgi:2-polyprenyl-3-methyl-5-hydroxy-6-metoxy-1,4-benzoquinol methylase